MMIFSTLRISYCTTTTFKNHTTFKKLTANKQVKKQKHYTTQNVIS